MKKFLIASLLSSILIPAAAFAEQAPVNFKEDTRIKRFVFDQNNVYKLELYMKTVTALKFGEGEDVQSILIGDSVSWEVVKLKAGNIISVKPLIDGSLTNMTVYTDRRVYTFELQGLGDIKPGAQIASLAFRAEFDYPDDAKPQEEEDLAIGGKISTDYVASGFGSFRPAGVQDNELQTTFTLKKGAPRPAVFRVGKDGKERLVNSRTSKNVIEVDGVSDNWVLRIGNEYICVTKKGAVAHKVQRISILKKVFGRG